MLKRQSADMEIMHSTKLYALLNSVGRKKIDTHIRTDALSIVMFHGEMGGPIPKTLMLSRRRADNMVWDCSKCSCWLRGKLR